MCSCTLCVCPACAATSSVLQQLHLCFQVVWCVLFVGVLCVGVLFCLFVYKPICLF